MIPKDVAGTPAILIASLCLVTCSLLPAQEVGNRVRVTIGGYTLSGDVLETSDAGFTLALSQEELREVSNTEIEKLEVRTCCMDHAWAYPTLAGMLVGGLLGAYAGDGVVCTDTSVLGLFGDETCEIHGNAFWWGILGGGTAGLLVGRALFREKWENIAIRDRSGPRLDPLVDIGLGRGGRATVALGARLRF